MALPPSPQRRPASQGQDRSAAPEGSPTAAGSSVSSLHMAGSEGGHSSAATSATMGRGKGSRGPRPRLFKKGECQADGCGADLLGLPRYNVRNHICLAHKAAESFFKQGQEVRFCQRCGVSHPLSEYDGLKKSCRRMLALHNSRRRKAGDAQPQQQSQPQEQPAAAAAALALPVQPADVQLLPAMAGMQLGAGAWAAGTSPAASVASAAHSEDRGSWLPTGGSGGRALGDISLPDPPIQFEGWTQQQQQAPVAVVTGTSHAPAVAAPSAAPAHERVCCRSACGACGACRASAADTACSSGAGGALVGCAAAGAGDAAAGQRVVALPGPVGDGRGPGAAAAGLHAASAPAGRGWGAAVAAGHLEPAGPAADAPPTPAATAVGGEDADDTADSGISGAVVSSRPVAGADAAARPPAAAADALEELQQRNAALYGLFVQQQLLAAHTLLATAGIVLSAQLPLQRATSFSAASSSVSAR